VDGTIRVWDYMGSKSQETTRRNTISGLGTLGCPHGLFEDNTEKITSHHSFSAFEGRSTPKPIHSTSLRLINSKDDSMLNLNSFSSPKSHSKATRSRSNPNSVCTVSNKKPKKKKKEKI